MVSRQQQRRRLQLSGVEDGLWLVEWLCNEASRASVNKDNKPRVLSPRVRVYWE